MHVTLFEKAGLLFYFRWWGLRPRPSLTLKLRPHHLVCLTLFRGKGYSPDFTRNVRRMLREIRRGALIELVEGCDDVCSKCPYIKDNKCMKHESSEVEVREMDLGWLRELGLNYGDKLRTLEVAKEKATPINLQSICRKCEWLLFCIRRVKNSQ